MPNFVSTQPYDFSGAGEAIGNALVKRRLLQQQQAQQQQELAIKAQNAQSLGDYRQSQIGYNKARTQTEQNKIVEAVASMIGRNQLGDTMANMSGVPGTPSGIIGPPTQQQAAYAEGLRGIAQIGKNPNEMANALKTILATRSSGLANDPVLGADVVTGTKLNPVAIGPDRSTLVSPNPNEQNPVLGQTPVRLGTGQMLVEPSASGGTEVGSGRFNVPSGSVNVDPNTGATQSNPKPETMQKFGNVGAALVKGVVEGNITPSSPLWKDATNYLNMVRSEIQKQQTTVSDGTNAPAKPTAQGAGTGGKQLDRDTAMQFLKQAGGDKQKARQMAKDAGYTY